MRTQKKQISNEARREFGAMAERRNRNEEPATYAQILFQFGFVERRDTSCFVLWQKLCEDAEVVRLSQEIERPVFRAMHSITSGYSRYGAVLSRMTAEQRTALKIRVGVQP